MLPLLLIHGYNHDPLIPKHSPYRSGSAFDIWTHMVPDRAYVFAAWYSAIQGRDLLKAWRAGCWNTYGWAYSKLAPERAETLPDCRCDIIAHSLGTRVALLAVDRRPHLYRRVLLLNGAETVDEALPIMKRHDVEYLNIAVKTDDVVKRMGAWFEPKLGKHNCIGNGIPGVLPDNVRQVMLDDGMTRARYMQKHGWDLRGDNPDNVGDHSYSYRWEGNWPLYRDFLNTA